MERTEILDLMGELKLFGMREAFDEVMANGLKRRHEPQQIIGELLRRRLPRKRHARSSTSSPLPSCHSQRITDFDFKGTPINAALVRDLATGGFLAQQRNVVLVGGTSSGRSHLAIAIARCCIRSGARGRLFNVVDLVNPLEAEARYGRQGRMADTLIRKDFAVVDELGYLPFAQSGGSCSSI